MRYIVLNKELAIIELHLNKFRYQRSEGFAKAVSDRN
jgi:hypothetical protein